MKLMVKVNVYGNDGSIKEKIDLPNIFNTPFRPDIIKKSFNIFQSNKRQPYGSNPNAGTRHSTASVGKGRGRSRVPRLTQGNRAALAPCVVGGRRAHPPKTDRNWKEKINKKERIISIKSALAATANKDLISSRGHLFDDKITLPIIIDSSFKNSKKTKEIIKSFEKIGIYDDIIRATNGKHIRAGKGKRRGRKYKIPKSILIIAKNDLIIKSSRNIPGVDIIKPNQININHLAPGGNAGRLTIFTKSAFFEIGGIK
jgi:large subunit ribosomal protein L4e